MDKLSIWNYLNAHISNVTEIVNVRTRCFFHGRIKYTPTMNSWLFYVLEGLISAYSVFSSSMVKLLFRFPAERTLSSKSAYVMSSFSPPSKSFFSSPSFSFISDSVCSYFSLLLFELTDFFMAAKKLVIFVATEVFGIPFLFLQYCFRLHRHS